MEQCERLRKYNRWRRGDERIKMPDPKELGKLIDDVACRLEVLEREHSEERRKREKLAHDVERCYRMLLSEPDTKGALSKAENILREALADQKVVAPEGHNVELTGCASRSQAADKLADEIRMRSNVEVRGRPTRNLDEAQKVDKPQYAKGK